MPKPTSWNDRFLLQLMLLPRLSSSNNELLPFVLTLNTRFWKSRLYWDPVEFPLARKDDLSWHGICLHGIHGLYLSTLL
jgi:hypothetical protein